MTKILVERLTPSMSASAAFARFADQKEIAFLDSNQGYGDLGRWSIIASRPWLRLRGWTDFCLLNGQRIERDPFSTLQDLLDRYRAEPLKDEQAHLPLVGGCIGAIAYDAGFVLNDLPVPDRVDRSQPLVRFDFYDTLILFDHKQDETWLMACGQLEPADAGLARLRQILTVMPLQSAGNRLHPEMDGSPNPIADKDAQPETGKLLSIPPREPYMAKVEQLREWIRLGEVYIANLTGRFKAWSPLDSLELYARFRHVNPTPFAALIRQENIEWLSASLERFFSIRRTGQGRRIETRPIKGTRPRSPDPARDLANRQELENSGKDRSELLMIVDLERNDLSRVCQPTSVNVDELFALETFPEVFHLVSTISGLLRDDVDAVACMKACFPGGSITGAPKMRSMELIECLEDDARGFYTGCLGYFSADGQADFSIIIRTMVRQNEQIVYGAGGGITWESEAAEEYQEILDKTSYFRKLVEYAANQ